MSEQNVLVGPWRVIDAALASRRPDAERLSEEFRRCGGHPVAECPSCGVVWQMNQLRHPPVGYYPGEKFETVSQREAREACGGAECASVGNHYGHLCPLCLSDVSDAVELHFDACLVAGRAE